MKAVYPYDQTDSREDKTLYMYSAFGGMDFLKAYREARQALVNHLRGRVPETIEPGSELDYFTSEPLPAPYDCPVITEVLIQQCLDSLAKGYENENVLSWMEVFCRKIEVSKRLHKAYGMDLKPLNPGSEATADTYARLALMFARALEVKNDLRWLNVLLKLNDLVSYQAGQLTRERGVTAAISAIEGELDQVRRLSVSRGLVLS